MGSQRVVANTFAQYVRTIINTILSLYTVRIVLNTLGSEDYGIYSIVAGVTAMLAFVTNALSSTTQRFMSFYQGKRDIGKLKEVFSNSELLHLALGIFIVLVLFSLKFVLFDGFLNIPVERIDAAKSIYVIILVILFVAFCTAPYRALLVSHENIVYTSIVDVADGVIKVALISFLPYVSFDKLIVYGIIMLLLQTFSFFAFALFCFMRYEECIMPRVSLFNKQYIKELSSYAGWIVYSSGCVVGRTQGIALVINKYLNTTINAAYGLGMHISGIVSTISTSVFNAMRPQIVRTEGAGDRQRALDLSNMLCKCTFFLMIIFCVPCIFEMDTLLELWLKDIPPCTVLFARMMAIAGVADSITLGLSVMNEATGKIRSYHLLISTIKLVTFPVVWLCMALGCSVTSIVICYVGIEFIDAFFRIPFLHANAGLDIKNFVNKVLLYEVVPLVVCIVACVFCIMVFDLKFRFLITFGLCISVTMLSVWCWGLNKEERHMALGIVNSLRKREQGK